MFAEVNGIELAYSDSGDGTPVTVLLHAFPLNRSMWDAQVGSVRARGRVVIPDLRGFGASERGDLDVLSMEQQADDLAALLDTLAIQEPVLLVGLSMGGYVALAFSERHRARVRGLVLADTKATADTEEARANRLSLAERVLQARSSRPAADAMLPKLLAPASARQPALFKRVEAMVLGTPPETIAAAQRGLARRPDRSALLPTMDVPVLVLVGELDELTPPADAERLAAALPRASLEVIPQAGHLANLENPDAFNQALVRFLNEVGALP